jgi:IPT/TIG domain-containing protein
MLNRFFARAVMAGFLALVGMSLGCNGDARSPLAPSRPTTPAALTVASIVPNTGSRTGTTTVTIVGTGFQSGATVTLDATATSITVVSSTVITAITPAHAAGMVDVVVTNPGGQSGRLTGAFTYTVDQPYAVTPTPNTVASGGQLSVSWTAPRGGAADWVGLFKVGDPNTSYEDYWWKYTNGGTSGTFTLSAPTEPGQYEFRYLLDDGFVDTVRSSPVAVTAGGA